MNIEFGFNIEKRRVYIDQLESNEILDME